MVQIPTDPGGSRIQLAPAKIALAVTIDTSISSSTEITLNTATRFIRVYAKTQDVYLKWGTADVTTSSFDEVIPSNQICDFIVPIENTTTKALYTAINLIEATTSASVIVIEK